MPAGRPGYQDVLTLSANMALGDRSAMWDGSSKSVGRVAIVLPSLRAGGVERVMLNLAHGFGRRGVSVDILVARTDDASLTSVPSSSRVIDLRVSRVIACLPGIVRYLRAERPMAMLSAMDHMNVVALLARQMSGVAVGAVASVHSNVVTAAAVSLRDRAALGFIRPIYPMADMIVAVSRGVADSLITWARVRESSLTVIHNPAVTEELFLKADEPSRCSLFDTQDPVIVAVGRLAPEKNFDVLIRAFGRVQAIRRARLVIIGEGARRGELEALVRSLNLEEVVHLPGFVENPFSFMKSSSLFVLSSRLEGFGNVLAEAMACGARIVSTDCPSGPSEILEDGRWGVLVPVGNVETLAEAMLNELGRPARAGQVESAIERFHVDRVSGQYLDVLGAAANRHRA